MSVEMRVAYLVNLYPAVSHTFIRREILALERLGASVQRIALRGWDTVLVDDEDHAERQRTHYVLRNGAPGIAAAAVRVALTSPLKFLRAARVAWKAGRGAFRPLPYHAAYLAEACVVLGLVKRFGATHLHAHFGTNSAEVAMLVHALGGPPYSFTVHGPTEFDQPLQHKLAEKSAAAAFVAAISSYGRSQLYRWLPHAAWSKVSVVRCGVDPAFRDAPWVAPAAGPRLVCVGRICGAKGQLMLIEAAARVIERGSPLELVIAGDGDMRAEVEALIDARGVRQRVRLTGWLSGEQVRTELKAARALVLPSFAEGLPVVVMEAMALGRPVLTTYVAGIPELVRHGHNGWLFPAGDVDALVSAIEECVKTSIEDLHRLGLRAREAALERHDVDREARKLFLLFGGELANS